MPRVRCVPTPPGNRRKNASVNKLLGELTYSNLRLKRYSIAAKHIILRLNFHSRDLFPLGIKPGYNTFLIDCHKIKIKMTRKIHSNPHKKSPLSHPFHVGSSVIRVCILSIDSQIDNRGSQLVRCRTFVKGF